MENNAIYIDPLLVDVPTACVLLSVKRTKLFELLRPENGSLQRVKLGGKTLVTIASIRALAGQHQDQRTCLG